MSKGETTDTHSNLIRGPSNVFELEKSEPGDISGIAQGCGQEYLITQPAIDDVPADFYPDPEVMNEDHIDCFQLGEIYASSGIRRRVEDGIIHEVDWALIEILPERLQDYNYPPQSKYHNLPLLDPTLDNYYLPKKVVPWKELGGLQVFSFGRTSGYQTGRISDNMVEVKIYGRETPSHSYEVSGNLGGK
jgi:hypothetical protein